MISMTARFGNRAPLSAGLAAACMAIVMTCAGCSIHLRYERGDLHDEDVLKTWSTNRKADIRIGFGDPGGSALEVVVEGSERINEEFEKKYYKIEVRESYIPLFELIEIPLAVVVPVVSSAVVIPLWLSASALYAFYIQGCVEGEIFGAWGKIIDGEIDSIDVDEFDSEDFALGLLFDFTGLGIPLLYVPSVVTGAVKLTEDLPVGDAILWFPLLLFGKEGALKAVDPTRNFFSWESKSPTGEYYSEKDTRHRDVSGPLGEREVEISILGGRIKARTDPEGRVRLEGRKGRKSLVRGLRRGTPLRVEVSVPGFETRKGGTFEVPETQFLSLLSILECSDWSKGKDGSEQRLDLTGNAETRGGTKAVLRLSATNQGPGTLHRVYAVIHSRTRTLDSWITTFGAIKPGETVERTVEMDLPRDAPPWSHAVIVEILGQHGPAAELLEVRIPGR